MPKGSEKEIKLLILRLLEGNITDSEISKLDKAFCDDPELMGVYCDFVSTYSALRMKFGEGVSKETDDELADLDFAFRELAQEELIADTVTVASDSSKTVKPVPVFNVPKTRHEVSRLSIATLIVSSVAALFLVAMVVFRPVKPIVATLTNSLEAKWEGDRSLEIGDPLRTGALSLTEGFASIEFDEGARIIVQGPANFKLVSPKEVLIAEGSITASVPKNAIGFTVTTPSSSVIDLGTQFAVSVDESGASTVYTKKGKVSLIAGQPGNTKSSRDVTAGQAKKVDPQTYAVANADVDGSELLFDWASVIRRPKVGGQLKYFAQCPPSLQSESFESDDHAYLFPERVNVLLNGPVNASLIEAGEFADMSVSAEFITARPVDSYIFHVDTKHGHNGGPMENFSGNIAFNMPVVAIAVDRMDLMDSDSILGLPSVNYGSSFDRGANDTPPHAKNRIKLSEDRKKISFDLTVRNLHQMRILVLSPENGQDSGMPQ